MLLKILTTNLKRHEAHLLINKMTINILRHKDSLLNEHLRGKSLLTYIVLLDNKKYLEAKIKRYQNYIKLVNKIISMCSLKRFNH